MEDFGKRLSDYNLPEPDERGLQWRHQEIPSNFDDMSSEEHGRVAETLESSLNNEQKVSLIAYIKSSVNVLFTNRLPLKQ